MKIGYALFSAVSVSQTSEELRHVIRKVAEMGYDGVEFFQYADMPAAELKQLLEECGLQAISTHVHKPRWDGDGAKREIAYAAEAGIPKLVYPWIAPELRTGTFYRALPGELAGLAQQCAEHGIKLEYHNHEFEFEKLGSETVLEHLLSQSDAYGLELDTFWTDYAGVDPVTLLYELGDRVSMIHMKDYASHGGFFDDGGEHPTFCPVGEGRMPNQRILECAREMNKDWLIVELDNSPLHPLESARISLENIRKMMQK